MRLMNVASARTTLAAVLAVGALSLAACGSDTATPGVQGDDGLTTLRVTTVAGVTSLPIKVAMEEGYFEKHGVKVELTEGVDVAAWQAALGKQFDISFATSGPYVMSVAKGLDNTLINQTSSASDDYITTTFATTEKLTDLSTLRGTKIGVAQLTGATIDSMKYLLADAGVKATEYELVQMPYSAMLDNMKAGNIDAALTAGVYFSTAEAAGLKLWDKDVTVAAHEAVTGGKVRTGSSTMYAANTKWVEANPDLVNAWVDGVEEGIAHVESKEKESRGVLQTWLKLPEKLATDVQLPTYTTKVAADEIPATWSVLQSTGTVKGEYPADKVKVYER
ncbi:ABC transporter substrate-binding protein [Kribbia dieselivorans]|uniref:ABC transporter substrate-binding protein n=1 Tax=Kribbia dieselivorans TaxID=331526 RepID=UPI0008395B3D|nr:ABC transporter substrate-binding protein [Kribbia dieselivorans]